MDCHTYSSSLCNNFQALEHLHPLLLPEMTGAQLLSAPALALAEAAESWDSLPTSTTNFKKRVDLTSERDHPSGAGLLCLVSHREEDRHFNAAIQYLHSDSVEALFIPSSPSQSNMNLSLHVAICTEELELAPASFKALKEISASHSALRLDVDAEAEGYNSEPTNLPSVDLPPYISKDASPSISRLSSLRGSSSNNGHMGKTTLEPV